MAPKVGQATRLPSFGVGCPPRPKRRSPKSRPDRVNQGESSLLKAKINDKTLIVTGGKCVVIDGLLVRQSRHSGSLSG